MEVGAAKQCKVVCGSDEGRLGVIDVVVSSQRQIERIKGWISQKCSQEDEHRCEECVGKSKLMTLPSPPRHLEALLVSCGEIGEVHCPDHVVQRLQHSVDTLGAKHGSADLLLHVRVELVVPGIFRRIDTVLDNSESSLYIGTCSRPVHAGR